MNTVYSGQLRNIMPKKLIGRESVKPTSCRNHNHLHLNHKDYWGGGSALHCIILNCIVLNFVSNCTATQSYWISSCFICIFNVLDHWQFDVDCISISDRDAYP